MDEFFIADLQGGIEPYSFPPLDMDPIISKDYSSLNNSQLYMPYFSDGTYSISEEFHHELQRNLLGEFFPSFLDHSNQNHQDPAANTVVVAGSEFEESKMTTPLDELKSGSGIKTKYRSGRGKRVTNNEKEDEKLKDVVHVRARRGQATDSRSLAERVRRGKINEKLKCLQNIVPACSESSMSMTVLLEETINYIHSLQNQVESLSTKLSVASSFCEFSSETISTAKETMQQKEEVYGSFNNHPSFYIVDIVCLADWFLSVIRS